MNGAYSKLGNRVIKNVERVGSGKVAGDLDNQRSGVDHTGLDNQDEDFRNTKTARRARHRAEDVPDNGIRVLCRNHELGANSPNPQGNEGSDRKVCSERKAEQKTVPDREDMMEGAMDTLSPGKVIGLTNSGG